MSSSVIWRGAGQFGPNGIADGPIVSHGSWPGLSPCPPSHGGADGLACYRIIAGQVPKLLEDVKAYLKSSPGQLDWNAMQIDEAGLGRRVAVQLRRQHQLLRLANT